MQKNAIHYHDSNGKYLHCFRYANAKRIALTMTERVLITLVANDGTATFGQICGMRLEDGSGKKFLVSIMDKTTNTVVEKFVADEQPEHNKPYSKGKPVVDKVSS